MYRLLIIEDEDDIRDNIKDIFEHDGNETFTAKDGNEGLILANEINPEVILCDIMMPGLDGYQVKKKLNEKKTLQKIPFIFLSAKAEITNLRIGMDLGADDYVVKPIRNRELLNTVYTRLRRIEELKTRDQENNDKVKLNPDDKILLKNEKSHFLIPLNNIILINVFENYTNVNLIDGKKVIQKKSLKHWEEILPDKIFVRVHHKSIVNFNYVEKIDPFFNGSLIVKVKHYPESVICSRRYSQKIKRMLNS